MKSDLSHRSEFTNATITYINAKLLKAKVGLEVLSDFAHKTLERRSPYKQLRALLVAADFAESNGARSKAVGLLDAAG